MKVLHPAQIQSWEEQTKQSGTSVEALMKEAVEGIGYEIEIRFQPGPCLVLAGKGHNGNDALWLGALLSQRGWQVTALLSHSTDQRTPIECSLIDHLAGEAAVWPKTENLLPSNQPPVLIIDGLLGLGANGEPRRPYDEIIQWVMETKRNCDHLFSLDIPSGFNTETGEAYPISITANSTTMIAAAKQALLFDRAASHTGTLNGVPISLLQPGPESSMNFYTIQDARLCVRQSKTDTYKHRSGLVSIFAGSSGMSGAASLCSRASLKAGAGLVKLYTRREVVDRVCHDTPEVMVHLFDDQLDLDQVMAQSHSILIGPGFGTDSAAENLLKTLLQQYTGPIVIDADAIQLLANNNALMALLRTNHILTPHWGEYQRMFPASVNDRFAAAQNWSRQRLEATLVLKGNHTFVCPHGGIPSSNGSGHPGMATAGMGDVLAGIISGLCAQGYHSVEACQLGSFWHGLSADLQKREIGMSPLLASDVTECLGQAWHHISLTS
ncbi:MAG: NAD(P)H-hydrate dehydratase [Verrucomicrobiota bacterium]